MVKQLQKMIPKYFKRGIFTNIRSNLDKYLYTVKHENMDMESNNVHEHCLPIFIAEFKQVFCLWSFNQKSSE